MTTATSRARPRTRLTRTRLTRTRLTLIRLRPWLWGSLGLVLALALAIGASRPAGSESAARRAATIDAALRCPSCEDLSVAASTSPAAVAIRQIVATRVRQGESTSQIEGFLEARYGAAILLSPPASGLSALVWVVPLAAVGAGLVGLGVFFWRRRRVEPAQIAEEDRLLVGQAMALSRARGAISDEAGGEAVTP